MVRRGVRKKEARMNRRDLVRAVAAETGQETKSIDSALRGFTDVVTAAVAKGEPVSISGFAKFAKVERAARMGRNPATGEQIRIKASKRARITALKGFKEAVLNPSQAPRLGRGVLDGSAVPAKKAAGKKAAAKKSTAKKATAKKSTAKRPAAKKTVKKKAGARKTARR
jgi:DNA-binding protein HU-beta